MSDRGLRVLVETVTGYWHRLLVVGVLSIAAAVIMLSSTDIAIATVALIAGISFLIHGAGEVALAMRLRTVHRSIGR